MGFKLAGKTRDENSAFFTAQLYHPADLPDGGGAAHLSGHRPGRDLGESATGQWLSVCLSRQPDGRGCLYGRAVAGMRDLRSALGAGATDDQQLQCARS
ncbi:hypothetical protein D3C80_1830890 [compost metagenome]